jgi:DnaK suppressor protein
MARKDALLRLHARLVARRDALRKALSGDMDSLRAYNATFEVGDNGDAAVETQNDEISTQLVELESRELDAIERALDRIVKGVYGRCEFCNEKIAEARLNALPYTSTCIDCQRENERLAQMGLSRQAPDSTRWAKLATSGHEDHDHEINLSDYEMDLSESGR